MVNLLSTEGLVQAISAHNPAFRALFDVKVNGLYFSEESGLKVFYAGKLIVNDYSSGQIIMIYSPEYTHQLAMNNSILMTLQDNGQNILTLIDNPDLNNVLTDELISTYYQLDFSIRIYDNINLATNMVDMVTAARRCTINEIIK